MKYKENKPNNLTISNKMIKNTIMTAVLALLLVACGGGGSDLTAKLDKLKKERDAIEQQIAEVEAEIAKTDTTKKEVFADVAVHAIEPVIFKTYIEVQGRVDAEESVNLSSEMPGTVTKINVRTGDYVTKGQVLAECETRIQVEQLKQAQVNLKLLTEVYEKQKALWEQKIGTEVQYLQAKTQKESLEGSINQINEGMRMLKIISPIDGTVDMVNIKVGQAVSPGLPAISVVNFSSMKVKADVAEAYSSRVKNNAEVLVLFPDMNDSIVGTIHYASRAINMLTRTFGVDVYLPAKKEYHPNTVAKLRINDYSSPAPIITVPIKFIQKGNSTSFVVAVEKGKVVSKIVTTGKEYNGVAEILSGLQAGDMLITQGYDMVNIGDEVNVVK
jgi:RND family efflux transporter MFP subunit